MTTLLSESGLTGNLGLACQELIWERQGNKWNSTLKKIKIKIMKNKRLEVKQTLIREDREECFFSFKMFTLLRINPQDTLI